MAEGKLPSPPKGEINIIGGFDMVNIVNEMTIGVSPEWIVLNAERHFKENPEIDCEFFLTKYSAKQKFDLCIGYDDPDSGEYYIEIWENFNDDEVFELGGSEPVNTWWFKKSTPKQERVEMLLDALDIMTMSFNK